MKCEIYRTLHGQREGIGSGIRRWEVWYIRKSEIEMEMNGGKDKINVRMQKEKQKVYGVRYIIWEQNKYQWKRVG